MKTVLIALLLCSVSIASNPDERTSITILTNFDSFNGNYTAFIPIELTPGDTSYVAKQQDENHNNFQFSSGLIVPIAENISLLSSISYFTGKTDLKKTNYFVRSENNIGGFSLALGIKIYIGGPK